MDVTAAMIEARAKAMRDKINGVVCSIVFYQFLFFPSLSHAHALSLSLSSSFFSFPLLFYFSTFSSIGILFKLQNVGLFSTNYHAIQIVSFDPCHSILVYLV